MATDRPYSDNGSDSDNGDISGDAGELGVLSVTDEGRLMLRFERRLGHPQAKVWRAITEPDQLRAWFAHILDYDRLRIELRPGARIEFVPKAEHAALGAGHGEVVRVDPPNLLEYTWDTETLRWELEPLAGGSACRLVFINIFDDRSAAAALGAGWHAGLDLLEALLDGRGADPTAWERLQGAYDRALG
jgi:uncharacterized protein YndB with AHSA1/START domain